MSESRTDLPSSDGQTLHAHLGKDRDTGDFGETLAPTLTPTVVSSIVDSPSSRSIAGYELLEELGRGGMGVVYKARQKGLNRLVALKMILHADHAGASDRARFQREAEALAKLRHENIVQVYEVGEYDGKPFFSLELIEGGSLEGLLKGTPLAQKDAAGLVEKLARATQAAHEAGIIHRDLTPSNVLLASGGRKPPESSSVSDTGGLRPPLGEVLKITDFGLAKKLDETGLSASGAIMGTPSYMAPEQAAGNIDEIDARTDVYALGAILYECLTGRPPFKAATIMDTLLQVMGEEPVPVRSLQPSVPRDLETICHKCLRKERERRYVSAQALADDLGRYLRGEPVQARPVGRLERGWRWCQRNPAVASLLALVVLLLAVGTVISTAFGIGEFHARKDADAAKADALIRAKREGQARIRAEEEEQRAKEQLYVNRLALAQKHWEDGKTGAAKDMLEQTQEYRDRWEHRYLYSLMHHRGQRTFHGHSLEVTGVCFSPDGRRIVSGSRRAGSTTGEVKIWDVSTGREILELTGHRSSITNVCYSPDGKWIAATTEGDELRSVVKVWDTTSGKEHLTFKVRSKGINCVCFSPDSLKLASLTGENSATVWEVEKGRELHSLQLDKYPVQGVCFSPDGRQIATWMGAIVKLWDASSGEEVRAFRIAQGISHFCISPDGKKFAGVTSNRFIGVWEAQGGKELLRFQAGESPLRAVTFRPDGRRIATAGVDGAVRVFDAFTGQEERTLKGHTAAVNSVHFSPDGRWIVSGSVDRTVKVWDTAARQESLMIRGHSNQISSTSLSPDGKRVVSGGSNGEVKVCDLSSGEQLLSLVGHSGSINSVCYNADGSQIASAGARDEDYRVRIWDAHTGQYLRDFRGHTAIVRVLAYSPDGKWLASAANDKKLIVWDASTGEVRFTQQSEPHFISSLCFSSDGKRFATAGSGLRIWDAVNWKLLRTIKGNFSNHPNRLAFSPDGRQLACAINSRTVGEVKIFDVASGGEKCNLRGHSGDISCVAYSPDGKRILSASLDGTVKLWDASTGQDLFTLRAHNQKIRSAGFSPDGNQLVTASDDGTIEVWDGSIGMPSPLFREDTGYVSQFCFSPDGTRLAISVQRTNRPGLLKIWDIAGAREVLSLSGFKKNVWSLCYTSDGQRLVAGCGDGTVWMWDANTGEALLSIQAHLESDVVDRVWVSPDSKWIASTPWTGDDVVRIWDVVSGKELLALKGHTSGVLSLHFSACGQRIVTGSLDRTVKVWDAVDGKELLNLDGHSVPVVQVAFSPDGKRVLSQDTSGEEIAWDLATGQPIPGPSVYKSHAWLRSPDGRYMVDREGPTMRLQQLPNVSPLKRRDGRNGINPDYHWHDQQAQEAFKGADWSAVVFHNERALRERPWDANQHVRHGYALSRLGRVAESAAAFTQAVLLDPTVRLWPQDQRAYQRASDAAEKGDLPTAAVELELSAHWLMPGRPVIAQPNSPLQAARAREWGDLLVTCVACGQSEKARETIRVLLLLSEVDQKNARYFAWTCLLTPCEEEVARGFVKQAQQLVESKRDDSSVMLLAAALYRCGQLEEAERAFEESDKLQGKDGFSESLLFRAMIRQRMGHGETARQLLAHFEKEHKFPGTADWRDRLRIKILHDEAKRIVLTMPRLSEGE